MSDDRRADRRFAIVRAVRAVTGRWSRTGATTDLSAGGAALRLGGEVAVGDHIGLDIEDVGRVTGRVTRFADDSIAVAFDVEPETRDEMAAAVGRLHRAMGFDDPG